MIIKANASPIAWPKTEVNQQPNICYIYLAIICADSLAIICADSLVIICADVSLRLCLAPA